MARTKIKPVITQEYLRAVLDYDPETGVFRWKHDYPQAAAGSEAGSLSDSGYVIIGVKDWVFRGHRLAWLCVYGDPVPPILDHIDGKRTNNRIANLRPVTSKQNRWNDYRTRVNDGKPWSGTDVSDLLTLLGSGSSIEAAAVFLRRTGTVEDVRAKLRELQRAV